MQATQDAVLAALSAAIDPSLAPVLQHLPQGTQPPFVKVGAIDTDSDTIHGEQFEHVTIEIQCAYRGEERGPLLDLMHAVRQALDSKRITSDGVTFGLPRFLSASASDASPIDGLTYAGVSSFQILAQPA
jgi:hypothetical protein